MSCMQDYYPAFLDLRGRRCVVVGGGAVAERKVASLLRCGADVVVVSPAVTAGLRTWAGEGRLAVVPRPYRPGDLEGAWLAIAATGDAEVNRQVFAEAEDRGLLVNVVDDPAHCNFIVPAVMRRGGLVLAISTGGRSPALARRVREELEQIFPEEYGDQLEQLVSLRARLRQSISEPGRREEAWRRLMAAGLPALLREGKPAEVEKLVVQTLTALERGEGQ